MLVSIIQLAGSKGYEIYIISTNKHNDQDELHKIIL